MWSSDCAKIFSERKLKTRRICCTVLSTEQTDNGNEETTHLRPQQRKQLVHLLPFFSPTRTRSAEIEACLNDLSQESERWLRKEEKQVLHSNHG